MSLKLQRRSDDAVETRDGLFAVRMIKKSGSDESINWFEYQASFTGPVVRVEWPIGGYAIIDADAARYLLRTHYAVGLTDEQVEEFNDLIEKQEAHIRAAEQAEQDRVAAEAQVEAAEEKSKADKAAVDKAAADKAAADKAKADADAKAKAEADAKDKAAADKK